MVQSIDQCRELCKTERSLINRMNWPIVNPKRQHRRMQTSEHKATRSYNNNNIIRGCYTYIRTTVIIVDAKICSHSIL